MPVYLLHSTVPLVRGDGSTVRHYLGSCEDGRLATRLQEHRTGRHSAKVLDAMRARGATFLLGALWLGRGREDERRMKRNGHLSDFCLVCQLNRSMRRYDALLSQARSSKPTSSGASTARATNSPEPSGPDAPGRTAG